MKKLFLAMIVVAMTITADAQTNQSLRRANDLRTRHTLPSMPAKRPQQKPKTVTQTFTIVKPNTDGTVTYETVRNTYTPTNKPSAASNTKRTIRSSNANQRHAAMRNRR